MSDSAAAMAMDSGTAAAMATEAAFAQTLADLEATVGQPHLIRGESVRAFATDIFRCLEMPLAMASPGSVEELQQVVRLATAAGLVLVPRGGGTSYTDGYLPTQANSLLLDLRRLDRIVEINEDDAYVTVEAGVTWQQLAHALDARGWRTPFRGPFSGAVATVGGTMAQNGISHGTGAWGVAAGSAQSLDVVLADGSLLRTGSALAGASPFSRHFGPDLTGLFLGDCGALGIKARVTLPLLRAQPDFAAASFGFDDFAAFHAGMRAAAAERVDDTHFGLDAAMVRGQLRRPRGLGAHLNMARRVWAATPGVVAPLHRLLRMAWAGERAMGASAYLAHYIVEGGSAREAAQRMARLRRAVRRHGREIGNTIPTVVRGQPFERMFHVLGPAGERWVPVHGLLPHSRVAGFHTALGRLLERHRPTLDAQGVWIGGLFECVGTGGFVIELGLYWRDAPHDGHRAWVKADELARLHKLPPNPALTDWIAGLRDELVALYHAHGAVHFQLGKLYPYASLLQAPALACVRALKAALDPQRRMNPGSLGL